MPLNLPVIKASCICKVFRTKTVETTAIDDLELEVNAGEVLSVMGPSGSGKSSLLGVLGLMEPPTSGILEHFGEPVAATDIAQLARLRRNLGFVFQNFALIDRLTVLDNVALALAVKDMPKGEAQELSRAMLERVGLGARASHRPHQLSGGQQQRVAIARALVGHPRIILADEPTGNLDNSTGQDIIDLLFELRSSDATVIMVTHDPRVGERADRILFMEDGRLAA